MTNQRHFFPGNNTPQGFFSYFRYILGQHEANRIYCIKGGPGVGKSSFMRAIGENFAERGEAVDFLHCSSDSDSLDAVVLKDRKIAFMDSTAPHIVDPITPGAVDSIIHLGDYWNEDGIRQNKEAVMAIREECSRRFAAAYNYLGAAERLCNNAHDVYENAVKNAELYKIAAQIVGDELAHKEICLSPGRIKKFFATAITPKGLINQTGSLFGGLERIYAFKVPVGYSPESILRIFSESAVYRGFDVEEFYCPLKPETKLEHMIVPKLGLALTTENTYHHLKEGDVDEGCTVIRRDLSEIMDASAVESYRGVLDDSLGAMDDMLVKAVQCLANAKSAHEEMEKFYIPNMDFKKIDELREKTIGKIL